MNSGKVDQSYRDDLKETNKKLAELLSKVESCKLTGPNMFDTSQTEDLSWMETEGKLQSVKTTTESRNNANKIRVIQVVSIVQLQIPMKEA